MGSPRVTGVESLEGAGGTLLSFAPWITTAVILLFPASRLGHSLKAAELVELRLESLKL